MADTTTDTDRIAFEQQQDGNVFTRGESVDIGVTVSGDEFAWTVVDYWNDVVASGDVESGEATLTLPIDDPGHYRLSVTSDGARAETSLAVLSSFDGDADDSRFGVATHFGKLDSEWHTPLLELIERAGCSWIRDELYWHLVEPEPGVYDFPEKYDYVYDAAERGLDPLIILSYVNDNYDGGATPYTDEGRRGFAEYGEAVLDEFGDVVDTVEVYNEFNNIFGAKGDGEADSQPEYYYELLEETTTHLRETHPDTTIVGGVTQNVPLDWLDVVFEMGGKEFMDTLSVHPYGVDPETLDVTLRELRNELADHDADDLPVWISELGWATDDGVPEVEEASWDVRSQARFLVKSQASAFANGVETFVWYDFMDDGLDSEDREHNFGLVRHTTHPNPHTPKPSYVAYATLARHLTGVAAVGEDELDGPLTSYVFRDDDVERRVVWAEEPWEIELATDEAVTVTDIVGDEATRTPEDGTVTLRVGPSPVYVTGDVDVTALDPIRPDE